jgi:AcrR family transcriptional regulator
MFARLAQRQQGPGIPVRTAGGQVPYWRGMAFSETATLDPWRDRALARSLGPARERSADRLERLVVAARDLANETGSASFTVAQVAAQAEVSLKVFYRYFASKDDLLVALLEEDSRIGAQLLADAVAAYDDPVDRLRAAVTGVFEFLTLPGALGYAGVLIREQRRLAESRPAALSVAIAPLIDVFTDAIDGAVVAGVAAPPDPRRMARTVLALVLDGLFEVVLGRAEPLDEAAFLWQCSWAGVRGEALTSS